MSKWSGEERRVNSRDHDLLTMIHADLSNFMKRFDEHAADDNDSFDLLDKRTSRLEKIAWVALGGFAIVVGILKYAFK